MRNILEWRAPRRFMDSTSGAMAVPFALAFMAVIGGLGVAVDYSMATRQRAATQTILDGASLAAVRENSDTAARATFDKFLQAQGLPTNAATFVRRQVAGGVEVSAAYARPVASSLMRLAG